MRNPVFPIARKLHGGELGVARQRGMPIDGHPPILRELGESLRLSTSVVVGFDYPKRGSGSWSRGYYPEIIDH